MMIALRVDLECGLASPPQRAKALVGDPGSLDAHASESMYGAPGFGADRDVGIEMRAARKCVFSVYNREKGEDEQP